MMVKLKSDESRNTGAASTVTAASPTTIRGARLQRLRALLGQSVSAISDQGFFALGNFAITTILARQMSQASFCYFSTAFAAFLLLSTFYCAFIVDPMLVYGVSTAKTMQCSYVRKVVALHCRARW